MSHKLQSALESGQETRIVQIDFIATFDRVNHLVILYKHCSEGIGGSVSILMVNHLGILYISSVLTVLVVLCLY